MEEAEKDYEHNYEEDEHKSFFEKYKSYLLLIILVSAIGYYWMKRFGGGSFGSLFPSRQKQVDSQMPINGDLENIKEQLTELRITSVSIQEEMNRLRFRFNELESKVEGRYLDEPLREEDIELENEDFEKIDLDKESSSGNDILFKFDDVNKDAIDDNIHPNSSEYIGIGTTFLMPNPSESGNFDATQALSEFKRSQSEVHYEFTITSKDGNQAEFSIYEDAANMIRAISAPNKFIKTVFRSNSILPRRATDIITDKKGLAIREGNNWRVIEKAVIRYK